MNTTIQAADRVAVLPDEQTLTATAGALERRGFGVEVADDLDAARAAVLTRVPQGAYVMTNTSATLQETGIDAAINESERYESARNRMLALDRATQFQQMKAIAGTPDISVGSVQAITRDGVLLLASATGSQHAAYAFGAARVILVVGAQKLVPDDETARVRIQAHCLALESARAQDAYGQPSFVGKILEIHRESPGRIHIVLIRAAVGF